MAEAGSARSASNGVVLLTVLGPSSGCARFQVFLTDLEELLLAGHQQILDTDSPASQHATAAIDGRLELDCRGVAGAASFRVFRSGKKVVEVVAPPGAGPEEAHLRFRWAVDRFAPIPESAHLTSLVASDSTLFRARLRAMRLFSEGRSGEAAAVLRPVVAAHPEDAALQYQLGRVLASWGSDTLRVSRAEWWPPEGRRPPLQDEGKLYLGSALAHLDHSLELTGPSPLPLLARGKVWVQLGRQDRAEEDFAAGLAGSLGDAELAVSWAELRLEKGETEGVESALNLALWRLASRPSQRRESIWSALGRLRLLEGRAGAAADFFHQALATIPNEQSRRKAGALVDLAKALALSGDVTGACSTWREVQAITWGQGLLAEVEPGDLKRLCRALQ